MTDVKWIKIVTDIFDDEKILLIESLPDADSLIVIWFKLLCLAGKQNNGGVFLINGRIPYTDEMFATIFRRPLNTVRLALATFEKYGMIEIVEDTVTIPNWGKHQNLDKIEANNEYMRNYMREYREKQKALISCSKTNCKTNSKTNVSAPDKNREDKKREEENILIDFNKFWAVYPRKDAKQDALKAWKSLNPNKELQEAIIADVQRRLEPNGAWYKTEKKYIKLAGGYLRSERWKDEGGVTERAIATRSDEPVVLTPEEEAEIARIYAQNGRDAFM